MWRNAVKMHTLLYLLNSESYQVMLGREKQLFYSGKHGHGRKMRHRMPFA
jgi:hypothetical protein